MKYKLRSSVSVVDLGNDFLEFFKTNTRKSIKIRVNSELIKEIVTHLDGNIDARELCGQYGVDYNSESTKKLFNYLKRKSILSNDKLVKERGDYHAYRRVIHFIEDYAESDEDLLFMWENIRSSRVVIIGLGAVGTWVAGNLVQSGVKNLTFIDNDEVELSNLHRQFGYEEKDLGRKKTTVLKNRLLRFEKDLSIDEYNLFLEEGTLEKISGNIDLIINCADKPTVDETSRLVGKYCMDRNIPHIVGGGYNLHLSLIGQTILPNQTACVNCFEKQLEEINSIDGVCIQKLNIKNRKIGSFGPMCTLIASMVGMEAIKVLSKRIKPDNTNRRGEFNIYDMNIKYSEFAKLDDCEWCGKGEQWGKV